jgi:hypothetical protein
MNKRIRIVLIVVSCLGFGLWLSIRLSRVPAGVSDVRVDSSAPAVLKETNQNAGQLPLDLSRFINGQLDRCWIPEMEPENCLPTLPRGLQKIDGVLFNITGVVQLQGTSWSRKPWAFQESAQDIEVGRKCQKFFVLHSTRGTPARNQTPVARFVIHYDGAPDEVITIRAGEHLLSWTASLATSPTDPNTVVAWKGENPVIAEKGQTLRVYKTMLQNPKPDLKVVSVDYASMMATCGPFVVGITAE